jgi:ABC-type transport system involved in multi-copper enzyme maturation permease subunit
MRQFFAILKDSFREAVDGFVIYVMLGLTVVLLLLLASLSFTPAPAEEVVPELVQRFALYIPDRGQAQPVANSSGVEYQSSDIKTDRSDVTFRLRAKGSGQAGADAFRRTVAGWLKPVTGPTQKVTFSPNGPKKSEKQSKSELREPPQFGLEFVLDQGVTDAEATAVTDEQMAAFVANQVETHFGISEATAKRLSGSAEPIYEFEVHAHGATAGRMWPHDTALFFGVWKFGRFPLSISLHVIEDNILNGLGAGIALIIGVVITAFFIPNMLRKGALDLLIAKPIGRTPLLIYKYIGGLTFVFVLSVAAIGGAWLVIGMRSGHWEPRFLLVIPLLTFSFAILYSISTLAAVITRSAIAAILLTLAFGFVLYLAGQFKTIADLKRNAGLPIMGEWPAWVFNFADTLNNVLPRYKDLDKLTTKLIDESTLAPIELRIKTGQLGSPSWTGTLGLSLAYIAGFLALACWRFRTRDG